MTIRWTTVKLGTKKTNSNDYSPTVAHGTGQANDVTVAWDDSVVTTQDHLIQGVRAALNLALGTLSK